MYARATKATVAIKSLGYPGINLILNVQTPYGKKLQSSFPGH